MLQTDSRLLYGLTVIHFLRFKIYTKQLYQAYRGIVSAICWGTNLAISSR